MEHTNIAKMLLTDPSRKSLREKTTALLIPKGTSIWDLNFSCESSLQIKGQLTFNDHPMGDLVKQLEKESPSKEPLTTEEQKKISELEAWVMTSDLIETLVELHEKVHGKKIYPEELENLLELLAIELPNFQEKLNQRQRNPNINSDDNEENEMDETDNLDLAP